MTYTPATGGYRPPPPPRSLRFGDLFIGVGALVVFGFSFAPFVQYSDRTQDGLIFELGGVNPRFNAWSLETFIVPLTTFVIFAALLGVAAVAARFGLRSDPNLLGFRLRQLEVGMALFSFLVLLGMVASRKHAVIGARRLAEVDPDMNLRTAALPTGWGAVLMVIGATIVLAGTLLNHFDVGPAIAIGGVAAAPVPPGYGGWPGGPAAPGQPPAGWQPAPPVPPGPAAPPTTQGGPTGHGQGPHDPAPSA